MLKSLSVHPAQWPTRFKVAYWLVFLCLVITRRLDQILIAQFYAEDGTKFFAEAETLGWASLGIPVGSYLNLIPRIIACLCRPLPWEWLPLAYNAIAAGLTALVSLRVLVARIPTAAAISGALAVLAVPTAGEVFLNICCLHFVLAVIIIVNLLEPAPVNGREALRRGSEIALAALSGPEVMVLLPLSLWCAWEWRRNKPALGCLIALWVAAAGQAAFFLSTPRTSLAHILPPLQLLPLYAGGLFAHWTSDWSASWLLAAVIVCALIALFLVNKYRVPAALLLLGAVLYLMAGRSVAPGWANPFGNGSRYVFLPFMLVIWSVGWLWAGTLHRPQRIVALVLLALCAASSAASWAGRIPPNHHWARQVAEARAGHRTVFQIPGPVTWEFKVPPGR